MNEGFENINLHGNFQKRIKCAARLLDRKEYCEPYILYLVPEHLSAHASFSLTMPSRQQIPFKLL